jgi:hypothetical protein
MMRNKLELNSAQELNFIAANERQRGAKLPCVTLRN